MPPAPNITLRRTTAEDLPTLFQQQLDAESNAMAGTKPFTPESYRAVWERIASSPSIEPRVIVENGVILGTISCFQKDGQDHVGYWIDRHHWSRGVASLALALFLQEVRRRPLHASAARSNAPSIRVLEKCGFRLTGYHSGAETERFVAREVATFVLE